MALPNLCTLSLREAPAPTGEFTTLSREQADELNDSGEIEPISHEEYVPSRELPDGDDYFRVRFELQKPDHTYDYTVYNAAALWRWTKDKYSIPHNRQPIWSEDWMALHERYDPQGNVPSRVARLPSVKDRVKVHEGEGDQRRLVRSEHPKGGWRFFDGPRGEERKVRVELPGGRVHFFDGHRGEERLVRVESPKQNVHYEGPRGSERIVYVDVTAPPREVHHFLGAKGTERLVRVVHKDDGVQDFYEGPKDEEHLVRVEWPNVDEQFFKGQVDYFEGAEHEEHLVRVEQPDDGHVWIYEGPKGEEHLVLAIWAHGSRVSYYDGPKGEARKVREVLKNGTVHDFEGPRGEERLVRAVGVGGEVTFFSPSASSVRHTTRTVYPDGRVETVSH